MTNPLLIDTCALLWLTSSPERISADVRRQIAESECRYVSSMTFWEIIFKYQIGKLQLELDPVIWLERVERKFALTVIDVSHEMMVNAALLPLHHRDPADRYRGGAARTVLSDLFIPNLRQNQSSENYANKL